MLCVDAGREASATSRSLVQGILLCVCVIKCKNNPLHLKLLAEKRLDYERKKVIGSKNRSCCSSKSTATRKLLLHLEIKLCNECEKKTEGRTKTLLLELPIIS